MTRTVEDISRAIIDAFPTLSPEGQRISLSLYRLLAEGHPVSLHQLSGSTNFSVDFVRDLIGPWSGIAWDREDRITGFWGLTLSPTKHRFRVGGHDLFTWCAWDTLFIPQLLGQDAEVESDCPETGQHISLIIAPGGIKAVHPPGVVLSFVTPPSSDIQSNVIGTFCCHVHFLRSRDEGEKWISRHPGTFLLQIEEALAVGARKNATQYFAVL